MEDHWSIFRTHVHLDTYPTKFDLLLLMYLQFELETGIRT